MSLIGEVPSKLNLHKWRNDWRKQRGEYPAQAKEKTASWCVQQTTTSRVTRGRPHSFHFSLLEDSSTPFNVWLWLYSLSGMALLAVKSRVTFNLILLAFSATWDTFFLKHSFPMMFRTLHFPDYFFQFPESRERPISLASSSSTQFWNDGVLWDKIFSSYTLLHFWKISHLNI